jgi:hypothetical protein
MTDRSPYELLMKSYQMLALDRRRMQKSRLLSLGSSNVDKELRGLDRRSPHDACNHRHDHVVEPAIIPIALHYRGGTLLATSSITER